MTSFFCCPAAPVSTHRSGWCLRSQSLLRSLGFLVCLLPLLAAVVPAPADAHVRSARAPRVEAAPQVDGWIDEPAWREAPVLDGFLQQRPDVGAPSTARTVVRLLSTEDALYVAFECFEPDPRGTLARALGRDTDLADEDYFALVLDTFDDDQNGFAFQVSPNGARTDLLVRAEGEYLNRDWDGIWAARTRVTDDGWQGEIEIPWRTLRFARADDVTMGVNFERQRRHVNEQSHWAPVGRPFSLYRVSLAGELVGLGDLDPGRNVLARPYALTRAERGTAGEPGSYAREDWDTDFEVGLDVKVGLTSSLTLDLTLNTDFAQVEVDDELVNLTRFPLFFPEKREFFLEKANLFRFGSGTNILFYSRSIGLDRQGRTLPIEYGTRLTGKIDGTEIGVIDIEQGSERGVPSRHFNVVRLRQDVGTRSSIGFMAMQRTSSGGDFDEPRHRAVGVDGDLFPRDDTIVSIYAAATKEGSGPYFDESEAGTDNASWGSRVRWSHPLWVLTYLHESVGADYTPRMGFVERTGVDVDAVGWEFTPEPDWKWIRRFENQGFVYWVDRRFGPFESRYIHVNPVIVGPSEQRISIYWERDFDRIFAGEEFVLGSDDDPVVFSAGDYTYDYWGTILETDPSHWWALGVEGTVGEFFDGDQEQVEVAVSLRRAPHWSARLELERARIDRTEAGEVQEFDSDVVRLRLGWDVNNAFGMDLFTQYNATADLLLSQLRAHWIFGDESDLYFVVTDARDDDRFDWAPRRSEWTLKLTYARQL